MMNDHHDGAIGLLGAPWVPTNSLAGRPKVSLHDHLDGSIRPDTLVELVVEQGQRDRLPSLDPDVVERWLRGVDAGFRPFDHHELFALLCLAMQTPAALERVASEFVDTLVADGVVYGEARWAPEKHQLGGLGLEQAVAAVAAGLDDGMRRHSALGTRVEVRQVLCVMRDTDRADEIIGVALDHQSLGVVGVDLAGMELGHPADPYARAFQRARDCGMPVTIHAGESDGVSSIWAAANRCYATRIGHGTRLVEDVTLNDKQVEVTAVVADVAAATAGDGADVQFGRFSDWARRVRLPLEQCVVSNSRWVVPDLASHPVDLLRRWGFNVTLNPDNRMLSGTSVSWEMTQLAATFGWTDADFAEVTVAALDAAFVDPDTKASLYRDAVGPGWATNADPARSAS